MITITQTVDLSLTENLVPAVIHVKQYDNLTRKIICRLYLSSTLVSLDSSVSVNISGTRPDGCFFQYSSGNDADIVFVKTAALAFG